MPVYKFVASIFTLVTTSLSLLFQRNPIYVYEDKYLKRWYANGKLHREDGPAVIWRYGTKEWYVNGELHREDGPAIIGSSGSQQWFINGERHREDGPAVIWRDGTQQWFINGKLHREDGPAWIGSNGSQQWWLNGKRLTKPEWWDRLSQAQKLRSLFSGEGV